MWFRLSRPVALKTLTASVSILAASWKHQIVFHLLKKIVDSIPGFIQALPTYLHLLKKLLIFPLLVSRGIDHYWSICSSLPGPKQIEVVALGSLPCFCPAGCVYYVKRRTSVNMLLQPVALNCGIIWDGPCFRGQGSFIGNFWVAKDNFGT